MDPTVQGFEEWLENVVQVPATDFPTADYVQYGFDQGMNLALSDLKAIPSRPTSPSLYATAVYNLGMHTLVLTCPDDPGPPPQTFWSNLRTQYNTNSFTAGVVSGASDQGTSESITVLNFFQQLNMMDLGLLQTPWGRAYMQIAGSWGDIWGLT